MKVAAGRDRSASIWFEEEAKMATISRAWYLVF